MKRQRTPLFDPPPPPKPKPLFDPPPKRRKTDASGGQIAWLLSAPGVANVILDSPSLLPYKPLFMEAQVDGPAAQYLTNKTLITLGVANKMHRVDILQKIARYEAPAAVMKVAPRLNMPRKFYKMPVEKRAEFCRKILRKSAAMKSFASFAALDTNGDGVVDQAELVRALQSADAAREILTQHDVSGSGSLTMKAWKRGGDAAYWSASVQQRRAAAAALDHDQRVATLSAAVNGALCVASFSHKKRYARRVFATIGDGIGVLVFLAAAACINVVFAHWANDDDFYEKLTRGETGSLKDAVATLTDDVLEYSCKTLSLLVFGALVIVSWVLLREGRTLGTALVGLTVVERGNGNVRCVFHRTILWTLLSAFLGPVAFVQLLFGSATQETLAESILGVRILNTSETSSAPAAASKLLKASAHTPAKPFAKRLPKAALKTATGRWRSSVAQKVHEPREIRDALGAAMFFALHIGIAVYLTGLGRSYWKPISCTLRLVDEKGWKVANISVWGSGLAAGLPQLDATTLAVTVAIVFALHAAILATARLLLKPIFIVFLVAQLALLSGGTWLAAMTAGNGYIALAGTIPLLLAIVATIRYWSAWMNALAFMELGIRSVIGHPTLLVVLSLACVHFLSPCMPPALPLSRSLFPRTHSSPLHDARSELAVLGMQVMLLNLAANAPREEQLVLTIVQVIGWLILRNVFVVLISNATARWYVREHEARYAGRNFARSFHAVATALASFGSACWAGTFALITVAVVTLYKVAKKQEEKSVSANAVVKWFFFFIAMIVGYLNKVLDMFSGFAAVYSGAFGLGYFDAGRSARALMRCDASASFEDAALSSSAFLVAEGGVIAVSFVAGGTIYSGLTENSAEGGWLVVNGVTLAAGLMCSYFAAVVQWNVRAATKTVVVCACEEIRDVEARHWCAPAFMRPDMARRVTTQRKQRERRRRGAADSMRVPQVIGLRTGSSESVQREMRESRDANRP